jgi:succinate dehydrogenase / fumarate reductase, cytochrome b subunit
MYKGGEGQWSFILHRVTGVGILLFLIIHVADTMLIMLGPEPYNHAMNIYQHPLFRPMEVGLYAAVLYHALNGLRICLIDFFDSLMRVQKQLFWIEMVLFTILFIWGSYYMVRGLWA